MLPRLQRAFALTFRQQRMPVQFTVSTNFTTLEKIFLESSERLKKKKQAGKISHYSSCWVGTNFLTTFSTDKRFIYFYFIYDVLPACTSGAHGGQKRGHYMPQNYN